MFKLIRKTYFGTVLFLNKILGGNITYDPKKMSKILAKDPSFVRHCAFHVLEDSEVLHSLFNSPNFDSSDFVDYLIEKKKENADNIFFLMRNPDISSRSDIMERLIREDGSFFSYVSGDLANDYFYNLAVRAKTNSFDVENDEVFCTNLSDESIKWWHTKNNKSIISLLKIGNKVPFSILKEELSKGSFALSDFQKINLNYLSKEEFVELCKIDGRAFIAATDKIVSLEAYKAAVSNSNPDKCFLEGYFCYLKNNILFNCSNEEFLDYCHANGNFFAFLLEKFNFEEVYKLANIKEKVDINNLIEIMSHPHGYSWDVTNRLIDLDGRFIKLNYEINLEMYRKAIANGFDLSFGFRKDARYFQDSWDFDDEFISDFITLFNEEPRLLDHIRIDFKYDKVFVEKFVNYILKNNVDFPMNYDVFYAMREANNASFTKLVNYYKNKLYNDELATEQVNLLFCFFVNSKNAFGKEIIQKVCDLYDIDPDFLNYQIAYASKINKDFALTLNPQMLQKKYRILYVEKGHDAYSKLYVLGTYPKLQEKIISIGKDIPGESIGNGDKRLQLLKLMLDSAIGNSESRTTEEWVPNFSYILEYVTENLSMFSYFADHLEELDDKKIALLTSHALGCHRFTIDSMDELNNYDARRKKYIKELYATNNLENIKEAFLEENLGVSPIVFERLLMFKLGVLEDADKYDKEIVNLFRKIDAIESVTNSEQLLMAREKITPLDFGDFSFKNNFRYLHLMLDIKRSILSEYNDSLYKINSGDEFISFEGCKFFKAAGDDGTKPFSLSIHSLGAYSDLKANVPGFNFSKNWNMPLVYSHGICSSYISNNSLATARARYAILGFNDYEEGALLTAGPYDLISSDSNVVFDSFSFLKNSLFLSPKTLVDYTRHTHNEVVFERRYKDRKRQPSYVVLDVDDLSSALKLYEKYSKAGRYLVKVGMGNDLTKEKNSDIQTADIVYYAIKCAKDFGIPIVVIEREKIAKNEWKKIQESLNEILTRNDFSKDEIRGLLHDTLVEFENNAVGSSYQPNIADRYFNAHYARFLEDSIKGKIASLMFENITLAEMFLEEFDAVCKLEEKKLNLCPKYINHKGFDFAALQKFIYTQKEVIQNFSNAAQYILPVLAGEIGDDDCIMEYSSHFDNSSTSQYSMSDVLNIFNTNPELLAKVNLNINMMNAFDLYINHTETSHSRKHAENVVLFSSIIGYETGIGDRDMDLLLACATFHDAGRMSEQNYAHAHFSASLAANKLNKFYSKEEIAMIQSVIEYHETRERKDKDGNVDYTALYDLCEKYGLDKNNQELMRRCVAISSVLKDADALDRTRFISSSRAFLKPEFLRYDVSRSLFKVGIQINEYYSKKDISNLLCDKPELISTFEEALSQTSSPKEVIRMYRKGKLQDSVSIGKSEVLVDGKKR